MCIQAFIHIAIFKEKTGKDLNIVYKKLTYSLAQNIIIVWSQPSVKSI